MKTILSVVIPVYNVEKFIGHCVKSLMEQSLYNIEYIFIDDKSTDNTLKCLKEYIKKYPERKGYVTIIENKANLGPSKSRNIGINIAKGEYITFCDSDDWIENNMYEVMIDSAQDNNCDMVWCDFIDVYQTKKIYRSQISEEDPTKFIHNILSSKCHGALWNKLFKRKILITNQIRFNENIRMWEDLLFTINLLIFSKKIKYINKGLYYYNQTNNSSLLSKINKKKIEQRIIVCDCLESLFVLKGVYDEFEHSLNKRKLLAKQELITEFKFIDICKWKYLWPDAINDYKHLQTSKYNILLHICAKQNAFIPVYVLTFMKYIIKVLINLISNHK
ncbi:MAG: glycosyltransferase [Phocaeicola sp.]|nr:glycosyltransferase [Phocaeicola sp.]